MANVNNVENGTYKDGRKYCHNIRHIDFIPKKDADNTISNMVKEYGVSGLTNTIERLITTRNDFFSSDECDNSYIQSKDEELISKLNNLYDQLNNVASEKINGGEDFNLDLGDAINPIISTLSFCKSMDRRDSRTPQSPNYVITSPKMSMYLNNEGNKKEIKLFEELLGEPLTRKTYSEINTFKKELSREISKKYSINQSIIDSMFDVFASSSIDPCEYNLASNFRDLALTITSNKAEIKSQGETITYCPTEIENRKSKIKGSLERSVDNLVFENEREYSINSEKI